MAENMKQVLERLRKEKQTSPPSKTEKAPTPKIEVPKEIENLDLDDDYSDEETPELDLKSNETPEKTTIEQQIAMEIEMLQNNGRFRVELLHQFHELNKSLIGIAEILVDISKKDGQS